MGIAVLKPSVNASIQPILMLTLLLVLFDLDNNDPCLRIFRNQNIQTRRLNPKIS